MPEKKQILLHTQDHIRFANQGDIVFCKSDNYYTTIYLSSGDKVMISKSLLKFSKELDSEMFIRVSQSFLVNKLCIKFIDKKKKQIGLVDDTKIPFTTTIHQLLILINFKRQLNT